MASLEGSRHHHHSLCQQEGGSLIQLNQQHLLDQECCQAPPFRGACPALENEDDDEVAKEERNLGKEGPEDEEERDSHAPEGLLF